MFATWTDQNQEFLTKWGGRIDAIAGGGGLIAGTATMALSQGGSISARMYFDAEL